MSKPKITIVDDDRDTRELLAAALEDEGFAVTMAANGLRLIASLQLHRPHAILLDVNMSWIDGFELCRAVKKNEQFRDIPVIFISGRGEPEDKRHGMAVGAADYFVKPLDMDKLVSRIRELVPAQIP
ncbi:MULTISPECIES: response regulator [Myxococcus]|uniref:Two-component system response regulator n=1 Tax=Myxococcus xanthus TaxID=34 RepID=A0AAE6KTS2_MYXXA|nr:MULTISPECIES: response regulator [Myxococcus]QDE69609.1 two-component system response regulator [Myxococcus xanthus]QDE76887.1 two-component system response regulator [Myxococcus xanthus]QDE84275.1 two-component system response regulator [Myxococcus xanthus]QDE98446.1 two-component system response regulator [Myxococcus xanthus]QDF06140.1 two-component system response regulator [Myxococcus xanthus]